MAGKDRGVGHFIDLHQYPGPGMEPPSQNAGRAVVLGEFGGYQSSRQESYGISQKRIGVI